MGLFVKSRLQVPEVATHHARLTVALMSQGKAFLPEVQAYRQYLALNGIETKSLGNLREADAEDLDAFVFFMGFLGRWRRVGRPFVCDFASRSVGPTKHLKDLSKRCLGKRSDLGVYQSTYVQQASPGACRTTFRDMGYFPELLQPKAQQPNWDIVYVGETKRPGLIGTLSRFAGWGMSVAVAGPSFDVPPGVEYLGKLDLAGSYHLMSLGRFGLNFVPSKSPYGNQQSTKLVEFAAAGLEIISNRTPWATDFVSARHGKVAWLEDVRSPHDLQGEFVPPYVSDLSWNEVMERTEILEWLLHVTGRGGTLTSSDYPIP